MVTMFYKVAAFTYSYRSSNNIYTIVDDTVNEFYHGKHIKRPV